MGEPTSLPSAIAAHIQELQTDPHYQVWEEPHRIDPQSDAWVAQGACVTGEASLDCFHLTMPMRHSTADKLRCRHSYDLQCAALRGIMATCGHRKCGVIYPSSFNAIAFNWVRAFVADPQLRQFLEEGLYEREKGKAGALAVFRSGINKYLAKYPVANEGWSFTPGIVDDSQNGGRMHLDPRIIKLTKPFPFRNLDQVPQGERELVVKAQK